jgi:hypothetical protein
MSLRCAGAGGDHSAQEESGGGPMYGQSVYYQDGNGWIWPGAVANAAMIAAAVWLFWLLVIGVVLVVGWVLVLALFGR